MSIIDAHLHLWEQSQFARPWLNGALARDFLWDDYRAAIAGLDFETAIYVETAVAAEHRAAEAHWILNLQRHEAQIAGAIISGDPFEEDFDDAIASLCAYPGLKGVRPVIPGQTGSRSLLSEPFLRAAQIIGERNLCLDLNLGWERFSEGASLARRCPDTRFVLDHCGNPGAAGENREAWKKALSEIAERPNVFCKVSGIVAAAPRGMVSGETLGPIVNHCAEVFGSERLIFGTDWPVCTLYATAAHWTRALQEIVADWSDADQRRLFHDNAARVYRLYSMVAVETLRPLDKGASQPEQEEGER